MKIAKNYFMITNEKKLKREDVFLVLKILLLSQPTRSQPEMLTFSTGSVVIQDETSRLLRPDDHAPGNNLH